MYEVKIFGIETIHAYENETIKFFRMLLTYEFRDNKKMRFEFICVN